MLIIMKHSPVYMKWFSRCLLLALIVSITYIVIQPSYNFSHWINHGLLKKLNIPYEWVLWGEQHADKFLHFFGAAILVMLIIKSQLPFINNRLAVLLVCSLCLIAEIAQLFIGRGFNSIDLLLGILGSFMAYLGIKDKYLKVIK